MTEEQFLSECVKRGVKPFKGSEPSIKKNMFTQGFIFNVTAGGTVDFRINLSGNVSELLGIVVLNSLVNDIGTLKVNNDILLQDTTLAAFNPSTNIYKGFQYFPLPRKLMGTDVIVLTVAAGAAHQIFPVFYCLPK
jgi:hypothetical protein